MFFVLLMCCCSCLFAGPFSKIIFFGDSLSDDGNLYRASLHVIPKSPPFYKGRFSNGPTWAENVAKYYYDKYFIDAKIYAYGGATACTHMPTSEFIPPTNLDLEVTRYLVQNPFTDNSKVLFAILIGGNDYLFYGAGDPEEVTTQVVKNISHAVTRLIDSGARNFVLLNLPDLSRLPRVQKTASAEQLRKLTQLHNKKLSEMVDSLNHYTISRLVLVDMYQFFNDMTADPDKYNRKYHSNITNLTEACWHGGYFLKSASSQSVRNVIAAKAANQNISEQQLNAVEALIESSPFLMHTFSMSYEDQSIPCTNASEHLFWDEIHPTEVAHRILAEIVIEQLQNTFVG